MLNDLVGESSLGTFPRATWNNWLVVAKTKTSATIERHRHPRFGLVR